MTNTQIDYVYADASNYKVWGREVLEGTLTAAQKAEILEACDGGELFIASQVGLPDLQHQMWNEHHMNDDDHVFHRLALEDLTESSSAPTVGLTASELLGNFRRVAEGRAKSGETGGWGVAGAAQRLGIDLRL